MISSLEESMEIAGTTSSCFDIKPNQISRHVALKQKEKKQQKHQTLQTFSSGKHGRKHLTHS
jgi:hypothetical protein